MALFRSVTQGHGTTPKAPAPAARPTATILARVDIDAMRRGHTNPGETCEIDGLGPVPVEALRTLLPDAAIKLIITNGIDAFNVTSVARRTTAAQQIVMDWIGEQCTRLGCGATRHLHVDHRIDWATIGLTELRNLDWLCPHDHRLKTHHGWALEPGHGKRRFLPPDHPDHPGDPPRQRAA